MRRAAWVGLVLYVLTLGATGCGDSAQKAAASAAAKLLAKAGKVELKRESGETMIVQEKTPVEIQPGDTVTADAGAVAVIIDQGHIVQVGHHAKTSVLIYKSPSRKAEGEPSMVVHLVDGLADFVIPPNEKKLTGDRFKAESNSVVAAVRGTEFQMEIEGNDTLVRVAEGVVAVLPLNKAGGFDQVSKGPMGAAGSSSSGAASADPAQTPGMPNPKEPVGGSERSETGEEREADDGATRETDDAAVRDGGAAGEILLRAGDSARAEGDSVLKHGPEAGPAAKELKARFFTLKNVFSGENVIMNF